MPSQSKSDAARANGAKSKGPVTPEGKARSAQNAIKHGVYAETVLLANESREAFGDLMESYIAKFQPADEAERKIVNRLVAATWREQRMLAFEAATINLRMFHQQADIYQAFAVVDDATRGALAFAAAVKDNAALKTLQSAISECGRQFARALRDLEKLRKLGPAAPVPDAAIPAPPAPEPQPAPAPPSKDPETKTETPIPNPADRHPRASTQIPNSQQPNSPKQSA